jgi:TnpA family transposase
VSELGRAVRTIFLLKYVGDVEIRRTVQSATNKSEEFNNFAQWSFFGSEGIVAENVRYEQRKIIKYNHLVANMIILHNVEGMTNVLKNLQNEGVGITQELLAALSPYRTYHIN